MNLEIRRKLFPGGGLSGIQARTLREVLITPFCSNEEIGFKAKHHRHDSFTQIYLARACEQVDGRTSDCNQLSSDILKTTSEKNIAGRKISRKLVLGDAENYHKTIAASELPSMLP